MATLRPELVTPPANPVLELDEAKQHAMVDHDDDDAHVTRLIKAATSYLDGWSGILGRCLVTQTWRQSMAGFPGRCIRLALDPVQQVDAISYVDGADQVQTVASDDFRLHTDDRGAYVALTDGASWPTDLAVRDDAVSVTYTAGYGAESADVPEAIRHAVAFMVADWYEFRESAQMNGGAATNRIPIAAEALLAPFRRWQV